VTPTASDPSAGDIAVTTGASVSDSLPVIILKDRAKARGVPVVSVIPVLKLLSIHTPAGRSVSGINLRRVPLLKAMIVIKSKVNHKATLPG
jgi:hypothetical protein